MTPSTHIDLANALHTAHNDYRGQSAFSTPGRHRALFDALPSDPAGVARTVQKLMIYEHVAEPFYGLTIPQSRRAESHIRTVEAIIDAILSLDRRPLAVPRSPEKRVVGICRHFTLLALAILRHHGIPARGRVGFGYYFNPGKFEDHWICEYWMPDADHWARLDVQFDDVFIRKLSIVHDVFDVPRTRFLTAAEAWRACRNGALDPNTFGFEFAKLRGLWFIAGSLVRDIASLNACEMLAWDVWGAQPAPFAPMSEGDLGFFDNLATLTIDPDRNVDRIRQRFSADSAVRVPPIVFNSLRQCDERVFDS